MSFAPVVDTGSLAALRSAAARGEQGALDEAAVHFEALFIGMLLKSARSASLGEGLLDGGDTRQYLEMMDAQVAQDIARRGGFGFGRMLVEQLGGESRPAAVDRVTAPGRVGETRAPIRFGGTDLPVRSSETGLAERVDGMRTPPVDRESAAAAGVKEPAVPRTATAAETPTAHSRRHFVNALLPHARRAAERLGVDPKLLVAQAALETGWGASIPRHADGRSTHNVFGMKAGASWKGEKAGAWTLEVVDGVPERRRADFRAYDSIAESFADYAAVIEGLSRYADARRDAADPAAYARAVADAGYATDPGYADKWLAVYRSETIAGAAVTQFAHPVQERPPVADNASVTAAQDGTENEPLVPATPHHPAGYDGLTARMD